MPNVDPRILKSFGQQWRSFDQRDVATEELRTVFDKYFEFFPWSRVGFDSVGLDAGCGSGRWAAFVAPRVKQLICVDASPAVVDVARESLSRFSNCECHIRTLEELPVPDGSLDFIYCLGVLHYIPDPQKALAAAVRKLKPGAPMLIYVYYGLDNRPAWFRALWRLADAARRLISALPYRSRKIVADVITFCAYVPLAYTAAMAERLGCDPNHIPLSAYRNRSLYTMRTDALDRFGSRIEHRFTREAVHQMMQDAGLQDISVSDGEPYWRAIGNGAARLG
jgi:SAM-dependent methyltransferase